MTDTTRPTPPGTALRPAPATAAYPPGPQPPDEPIAAHAPAQRVGRGSGRHGPARGPAGTAPRGPAGPRPAGRSATAHRPRGTRGPHRRGTTGTDPAALAVAFGTLFLEVESGRRSRQQLEPLLDPLLYATLAPFWVRPGRPGRVVGGTGVRTGDDRYDAVLVVRRGERVGAVAVALRRWSGRWRVERAARPEDGVLPPPPFAVADDEPDVFDLVGPLTGDPDDGDGPAGHPRADRRLVAVGEVG